MSEIEGLLQPPVFFGILFGLLLIALLGLAIGRKLQRGMLNGKDQQIAKYREEIARLQKELELAAQMHEGLKGQYDELEKQIISMQNSPGSPQK